MSNSGLPARREAEDLLRWAEGLNPGPWSDHCRVVARAAETIASHAGMDPDRAYVSGLLHDIGRYEGVTELRHVYAGYRLLTERGFPAAARICLTHSFPFPLLEAYSGSRSDCTLAEQAEIRAVVEQTPHDDWDALIQLCDALGTPRGVCVMEARLLNVSIRHGLNDHTLDKWRAFLRVKSRFDGLCGGNLYRFFLPEIIASLE
ncbi:MAG TPA: HD domain-containing protein [Clostridia bacterium]|nr:HD domain-containing protein [Clostridia bacterium]